MVAMGGVLSGFGTGIFSCASSICRQLSLVTGSRNSESSSPDASFCNDIDTIAGIFQNMTIGLVIIGCAVHNYRTIRYLQNRRRHERVP